MKPTKEQRAQLRRDNRTFPKHLVNTPREHWPKDGNKNRGDLRISVMRSRDFLVQVFPVLDGGTNRISVNRTDCDKDGNWLEGITWEELMQIKREAGFAEELAVEFYPPDKDIVNVANMRHLFLVANGELPRHWTA